MQSTDNNIHPIFEKLVSRQTKEQQLGQRGKVLWFTGLSGSGKSTIAQLLEKELTAKGHLTKVLDGDNVRMGINNNLGFSEADRHENIRRIAEVAKLFADTGIVTLCSFISPTIEMRAFAKNIIGEKDFVEIFVNTPIEICEARDVKGLYKKARAGEIKQFTGIDAPYQPPLSPDIQVNTADQTVEQSVGQVVEWVLPLILLNQHQQEIRI